MTELDLWCAEIVKAEMEYSRFLSEQSLMRIAQKAALKMKWKIMELSPNDLYLNFEVKRSDILNVGEREAT